MTVDLAANIDKGPTVFLLLPSWFLVVLGFLIVLCLPFWIIRGIIEGARRSAQEAEAARMKQAKLAGELRRMVLKEEEKMLLNEVRKHSAALAQPWDNREGMFIHNDFRALPDAYWAHNLSDAYWAHKKLIERPATRMFRANELRRKLLAIDEGYYWGCIWTKSVERADIERDSRVIRLNLDAYADKTDSEFEADVLALIGQLNSEYILGLVKKGLGETQIVLKIKSHSGIYSLGVVQASALKNAGVSDSIVAAMARASTLATNDPVVSRT